MTMCHCDGHGSGYVFLTKGKTYPAGWAISQSNWAEKQKISVPVDGSKPIKKVLLGSEYEIIHISKREQSQRNKAKHLNALALFWRCHVEHGKPQGWIAEHKPKTTDEYIGNQLHRKLTLLERRAHRAAINLCNVTDYQAKCDRILEKVTGEVRNLFGGKLPAGFTVNRDPRGYALKLEAGPLRRHAATPAESLDGLRRDWGEDFVLAPSLFN